MLIDDYTDYSKCEAEIRKRLITALTDERLLNQGDSAHRITELFASELPPAELLRRLADERLLTVTPTNLDRACAEIADSVVGLQRARLGVSARLGQPSPNGSYFGLVEALRKRANSITGESGPSALLSRWEQLVCDGHPASPAAKTTLGIGDAWAQVLPEQVEVIQLRFAAVRADLVCATGVPTLDGIAEHLPRLGSELRGEIKDLGLDEHVVIPVHPFQWDQVIQVEFDKEIAAGDVRLLQTTVPAEPLMSVRTLRVSDGAGAMHIKVALDIQLTGAVRGISAGAVAAPLVSKRISEILSLDTGFNPRTATDESAFAVAEDIGAVRFNHDRGRRAHCFGAVLRKDPAADLSNDEVAMPVAALLARNPLSGNSVLSDLLAELGGGDELAEQWFEQLGRLLFVPVVALLARWAVAVEPHPQNTVIVLRDGWPTRVIVRDLGGCRVLATGPLGRTELGKALQGTALLETNLTRLVDKTFYPLVSNLYRHLLTAAALSDSTQRQIANCISTALADEYWRTRAARLELTDSANELVFRRLLGPVVPVKKVLGMRLSGAVTEQDYTSEPNPLSASEMLTDSYLQCRVEPWLGWADDHVRRRIVAAAQEEGLSQADLQPLADDIDNARKNLALVRAQVDRRVHTVPRSYWDLLRPLPAHEATAAADSLAITGHNVHPLAKLRRGFDLEESYSYGPESGSCVDMRFLAVHRTLVDSAVGPGQPSFEELLQRHFPGHIHAARDYLRPRGAERDYAIITVHPWQLHHVIKTAYAAEISAGKIVVIPGVTLAARPTISLRTLIPHAPGQLGYRPLLKCALDVTLTSTRRSISQDSALGTPRVAALVTDAVERLRRHAGLTPRVEVVPELAGIAWARDEQQTTIRRRGLSALLREDVGAHLGEGEIAVSAAALRGHDGALPSPLADFAPEFIDDYAYDLAATVFGLMFFHGIALEQHLQNTMVRMDITGQAPQYRGLLLRDFSGLRAFGPRLMPHERDAFERGAITLTDDYEEFLNKGFYACIFGNLQGIVEEMARSTGEKQDNLWARVNTQIQRVLSESALPIPVEDADWIYRPTIRCKGFLTMGLAETGADVYVERTNPLVGRGATKR